MSTEIKITKVLQVNKYFDVVGGIEDVVRQLSGISDSSIEMTTLACASSKESISEQATKGRVIMCPILFTAFRTPVSFTFFSAFRRELRQSDVVHLHMPFPVGEVACVIFSRLLSGKRLVVTYHADIVKQRFLLPFYAPLVKAVLRRADAIVVTSPAIIEHSEFLKPVATKCVVISPAPSQPVSEYERSYSDFTYLLFVGRLVYYKGLTYLLEALEGLDIPLKISGGGPDKQALLTLAAEKNLTSVEFLGYVDDATLDALYRGASAFVFPSVAESEAFGLVQVSAMMHGLPVINTDLPTGVPWVARNEKEALTVPPKDSVALKNALQRLVADAVLRERLGKSGKERAKQEFTLDQMLSKYADEYTQAAKK